MRIPTPMNGKQNRALSLYFHIPFCHKKCPYCHFYVVPNRPSHREGLEQALLTEIEMRSAQMEGMVISSIYFGGGTPTLFGPNPISALIHAVQGITSLAPGCEITIEANPEDVTLAFMQAYREAGINRVSIGVQSLEDASLQILERGHSAKKAIDAIEATYLAGIKNISIDLMMELPHQTPKGFKNTLDQLDALPITHLSLYNLTIEPHTPFSKRKLTLPSQEEGLEMLEQAVSTLESIGLKRYEISAFARNRQVSHHNLGYWTARPFFGFGPSAFSYFEGARFRNIPSINRYMRSIAEKQFPIDFEEKLPYPHNVQERLAVGLRLLEGIDLPPLHLPQDTYTKLSELEMKGFIHFVGERVMLSEKGLLFYDTVASELV